MADRRYIITIDADGNPAAREIGSLRDDVKGLDSDVEDIGDTAGDTAGDFDIMGDAAARVAGPLAVGAIVAGLAEAAEKTADIATETGNLATVLDLPVEEASRLRSVFTDAGIEADELISIATDLAIELQDDVELAERFGIEAGESVSQMEAISLAIDNWDLLTPTERVQIFGADGAAAVGEIVQRGEDLESLMDGIADTRLMSQEDIDAALEYESTIADIKAAWEQVVTLIGTDLIEGVNTLRTALDSINDVVPDFLKPGSAVFDTFSRAVQAATNPLGGLRDVIEDIGEEFGDSTDAAEELGDTIESDLNQTPKVDVDVDDSEVDDARSNIDSLDGRRARVTVNVAAQVDSANRLLASVGLPPLGSRSTTNNLTINMPGISTAGEVDAAIRRWRHTNG